MLQPYKSFDDYAFRKGALLNSQITSLTIPVPLIYNRLLACSQDDDGINQCATLSEGPAFLSVRVSPQTPYGLGAFECGHISWFCGDLTILSVST